MLSKKGQEFAISTIIYALIIIIAVLTASFGIHKQFTAQSQSAMYRLNALRLMEQAEMIKQSVDQERRYMTDKAMYFVGSFGGYDPVYDLARLPKCTENGYQEYSLSLCIDDQGNKIDICEIVGGMRCQSIAVQADCIAKAPHCEWVGGKCTSEISTCVDTAGNLVSQLDLYKTRANLEQQCGISTGPYDETKDEEKFLPEREFGVPYWKKGEQTCIPTEQDVLDNFVDIVNSYYKMDNSFVESINARYPGSVQIKRNFYFTLDDYDKSEGKWIEYSWHPVDDTPIKLFDGPTENESTVIYESPYFVNAKSDTPFVNLYRTTKWFVEIGGFDYIVQDIVRDFRYVEADYIKNDDCVYYNTNDSAHCNPTGEKTVVMPGLYDPLVAYMNELDASPCDGYLDSERTDDEKKLCIEEAVKFLIMERIKGRGFEDTGYNLTAVVKKLEFLDFDVTIDSSKDISSLTYKDPKEMKAIDIKLDKTECYCKLEAWTDPVTGYIYTETTGSRICTEVFTETTGKISQWPNVPNGLPVYTECVYEIVITNNGDKSDSINYDITFPTVTDEQTISGTTRRISSGNSQTIKITATSVCPHSCKLDCENPHYKPTGGT